MSRTRFYNPQFDLFLPSIVDLRFRDQKDTMERPFFSLSKSKRMKPIEYMNENDGIFVTVQPHQDYGMATIWDADILIWAASVLCDLKNRGVNDIPRVLTFQPHDLLKAILRSTGGREYGQLRDSLERLKSTVITTNIRTSRGKKDGMFSWIDQWDDLIDADTRQSRGLTVTVSDWFYRGVLEDGGVLSIDPAYFQITGGRERWLYRVARKHAGGNGADGFAISMPTLFEKSGAEGTYRRFKFEILRIVKRNDLPGFSLAVREGGGSEPLVHMLRRDSVGEGATHEWRPTPKHGSASAPCGAGRGRHRPRTASPESAHPLIVGAHDRPGTPRIPRLGRLRPQGGLRRVARRRCLPRTQGLRGRVLRLREEPPSTQSRQSGVLFLITRQEARRQPRVLMFFSFLIDSTSGYQERPGRDGLELP